jgi:hypothetical protein
MKTTSNLRGWLLVALALASQWCSAGTTDNQTGGFAIFTDVAANAVTQSRGTNDAQAILAASYHYVRYKPQAKPAVHVEGVVATRDFDVIKDWPRTLALAISWRLNGNRQYLDQTAVFMTAWLDTFALSQAPLIENEDCLQYPLPATAQCLDPIDDAELTSFILSYDIARAGIGTDDIAKMQRFMSNLATSYLRDISLRRASSDRRVLENEASNWQSHRVELATLAAFVSGDEKLVAEAHRAYLEQLERNMVYQVQVPCGEGKRCAKTVNDGSVYDFYTRDALHYVTYDLDPLLNCALAAQAHGQNWYNDVSPSGASLPRAVAWLLPYATGEKTHEEFVNSTVGFDRQRAKLGWAGYSGLWDPKSAETLFRKAVQLDSKLASPAVVALNTADYPTTAFDIGRSESDPLVGFLFRDPHDTPH